MEIIWDSIQIVLDGCSDRPMRERQVIEVKEHFWTDERFKKICSASRSVYNLLPPYRTSDLRLRSHPFQLSKSS